MPEARVRQQLSIPLFPLRLPLHSQGVLSLQIFEIRYLDMVRQQHKTGEPFGVVALHEGDEIRKPGKEERFASLGTLAHLTEFNALQPALLHIVCEGGEQFRIRSSECGKFGLWRAEVDVLEAAQPDPIPPAFQSAANALGHVIAELRRQGIPDARLPIRPPFHLDEAGWVADRWAEIAPLSPQQRQTLLETHTGIGRLAQIMEWLGGMFDAPPAGSPPDPSRGAP